MLHFLKIYCIFAFSLMCAPLFAHIIEGKAAEKLIAGTVLIEFDDENHLIKRINFNPTQPLKAENIENWLLKFNQDFFAKTTFKFLKKTQDKAGFSHLFYEQYYQNHKIEYAILKIHLKNEIVQSINAELYTPINDDNFEPTHGINAANAQAIAKEYFVHQNANEADMEVSMKALLFFPLKNNGILPCYKIDIYSHTPTPKRSYLYISAKDGAILFEEDRIEHTNVIGTAVTKYCGTRQITTDSINATTFYLNETGVRNIHTKNLSGGTNYTASVEFVDADNYWNTTANQDDAAHDAHFSAEKTWDYYYLIHGLNSYNNAGATINSYVHYNMSAI